MGTALVQGRATHGMVVWTQGEFVGCDDQPAERPPQTTAGSVQPENARTGAETGIPRHNSEIPLALIRFIPDRECAYPSESDVVRRAKRQTHALRLHPGRLRLRMPLLRQWFGRVQTQPGAG